MLGTPLHKTVITSGLNQLCFGCLLGIFSISFRVSRAWQTFQGTCAKERWKRNIFVLFDLIKRFERTSEGSGRSHTAAGSWRLRPQSDEAGSPSELHKVQYTGPPPGHLNTGFLELSVCVCVCVVVSALIHVYKYISAFYRNREQEKYFVLKP